MDGCGMCTQSAGSEDEEEGEEEEGPPPPQMARPGYLSLRPGEGAVGMPTVTVTTAAALQAMVEEEEGRMEEGRVRSAKRRRRRRAGGMRAAAELEAARAAVEFVLNGMDPQLWNGFSALMG